MADPTRAPRLALLSWSSGQYDFRTVRIARSAVERGFDVTVYARWEPGLPVEEPRDGYRLIRVPFDWRLAWPILRGRARRELDAAMRAAPAFGAETDAGSSPDDAATETDEPRAAGGASAGADPLAPVARPRRSLAQRLVGRVRRPVARARKRAGRWLKAWQKVLLMFPFRPMGWAVALDAVTEPADLWHGMWAGSLPAVVRQRRRHGGRAIYDSRDVYLHSREFARTHGIGRRFLAAMERRWARQVDRVLTVNDAYAGLLVEQLGIPRPVVVMNCPERWDPPRPRPDRLRDRLGLDAAVRVALYQGRLTSDRGIEQSMDAILQVPDTALVLLGFGAWQARLTARARQAPYLGRVFVLPPVPPDELLTWTASADVSVMAIQPTSVNHRFTTPQKLFESLSAGVPVVASDLPGMATIVRETGAGALCDPTAPASIAEAIRTILDAPSAERERFGARALAAAHERYDWASQAAVLFDTYAALLARP